VSPNYVINKISNFKFSLTQTVVLTDLSLAFRKFVCCSVFYLENMFNFGFVEFYFVYSNITGRFCDFASTIESTIC